MANKRTDLENSNNCAEVLDENQMQELGATNSRPLPVNRGGTGRTNLVGANSLRSDMGLGTEEGMVTAATIGLESPTSEPRFNTTYMPWITEELPNDGDLDELLNPGLYRITATVSGAPPELSNWNEGANSAIIQVMPILHTNLIQVMYHANGRVWRRTRQNSVWGAWVRSQQELIAGDNIVISNSDSNNDNSPQIISFDSDVNLSEVSEHVNDTTIHMQAPTSTSNISTYMPWLSGALPNTNLDEVRRPGFYRITVAVTNAPDGLPIWNANAESATLQVMPVSDTSLIQVLYHNNRQVWQRAKQSSHWTEWVRSQPQLRPGNNITITPNADGTQTISSTSGPGGADLTGVAMQVDLDAHIGDTTAHMQSPDSASRVSTYMPWLPAVMLPNTDLDEVRDPGFYRITVAVTNAPSELPPWNTSAESATLQVMPISDTNLVQMMYHTNGQVWRRAKQNSNWTAWARLQQELREGENITITANADGTQTISATSGSGGNPSELQAELDEHISDTTIHMQAPTSTSGANTYMPWLPGELSPNTNLNEVRAPGYYRLVVDGITNAPDELPAFNTGEASATLQVMPVTNERVIQVLYHNNGQIWRRMLHNTTWIAWSRIDGTDAKSITAGTLEVARGGTGASSLAIGQALIGNGSDAVGTRNITNNTSSTHPTSTSNALVTEQTLHHALPIINNQDVSRNITIFAPNTIGTSGQVLISGGNNETPTWTAANNHAHVAADVAGVATAGHNHATSTSSVVLGNRSLTENATLAVAIGDDAHATGNWSSAYGSGARATNDFSIAIGNRASATGGASSATGHNAQASGSRSSAFGIMARAGGSRSTAIGDDAIANGQYSTALGMNARVDTAHANSTSLGRGAFANGTNQVTLGNNQITTLRCNVNTITTFSDTRLKENLQPANTATCLEDVKRLPVSRFKYKDYVGTKLDQHRTGFMADDVEKVFPKAVQEADEWFPELDENGQEIYEEERDNHGNIIYDGPEFIEIEEQDEDGNTIIVEKENLERKPRMQVKKFLIEKVKTIANEIEIPTLWGAVQELSKLYDNSQAENAMQAKEIAELRKETVTQAQRFEMLQKEFAELKKMISEKN